MKDCWEQNNTAWNFQGFGKLQAISPAGAWTSLAQAANPVCATVVPAKPRTREPKTLNPDAEPPISAVPTTPGVKAFFKPQHSVWTQCRLKLMPIPASKFASFIPRSSTPPRNRASKMTTSICRFLHLGRTIFEGLQIKPQLQSI